MVDLDSLKIPVFPGINDIPKAPTAEQAGNGSDLIQRFNSLTNIVHGLKGDSSNVSSNKVGRFIPQETGCLKIAGFLDTKSAFKIIFPPKASLFYGDWAIDFRDNSQFFNIFINFGGFFSSDAFKKFNSVSTISYYFSGFYPNNFNVETFISSRFGDGLNLDVAKPDFLNFSAYSNGDTRELHIYNLTNFGFHFVTSLDYSFDILVS